METIKPKHEQTSEPKIFKAMCAIMKESEAIGKDQRNRDQGFAYRGIDDIYNSLHSIFGKHGVFTLPTVLERTERFFTVKSGAEWIHVTLKVAYKFIAEDGSSVEAVLIGEGRDSSDKGSNKALAVAHKYCLLQAFCIPTIEEKDPDAHTVEGIPKVQQTMKVWEGWEMKKFQDLTDENILRIKGYTSIEGLREFGKELQTLVLPREYKKELSVAYNSHLSYLNTKKEEAEAKLKAGA